MRTILFIALGGSAGAVSRYLVSRGLNNLTPGIFPLGTLFVNITGSLLIGFLFSWFSNIVIPTHYKSMITVGFLGAFTTFSTFSLESANLLMDGEYRIAVTNILLNNILSLSAVIGGIFIFRLINNQGS